MLRLRRRTKEHIGLFLLMLVAVMALFWSFISLLGGFLNVART
jgi:hypothetical protein